MSILVVGGAGLISSNFMHDWLAQSGELLVHPAAVTYAGNIDNMDSQICDADEVVAWPEEIAYRQQLIGTSQLKNLARPLIKKASGQYLLCVLKESTLR